VKDAPAPRLCHIVKRSPEEDFGFNLLADKKRKGQFIGRVDAGSPAEASGLRLGDRIVEVNRVNVMQQTHKQVISPLLLISNVHSRTIEAPIEINSPFKVVSLGLAADSLQN